MNKKIMLVSVIGFLAVVTMMMISSTPGINTETDLTGNAIGGLDRESSKDGSVAPIPKVYANACNADGICEIIELQVSEDANLGGNLLIEGNIFTKGITAWEGGWFGGNVFVNGTIANPNGEIQTNELTTQQINTDLIYSENGAYFGASVVVNGTIANHNGKIIAGDVWVWSEAGGQDGYACISSTGGKIYKSMTPCVS